jgi:hypothetical protein
MYGVDVTMHVFRSMPPILHVFSAESVDGSMLVGVSPHGIHGQPPAIDAAGIIHVMEPKISAFRAGPTYGY